MDVRLARGEQMVINAVKVRYEGWASQWDDWVSLDTRKVRRLVELAPAPVPEASQPPPAPAATKPRVNAANTEELAKPAEKLVKPAEKLVKPAEKLAKPAAKPMKAATDIGDDHGTDDEAATVSAVPQPLPNDLKVYKWKQPRTQVAVEFDPSIRFTSVVLRMKGHGQHKSCAAAQPTAAEPTTAQPTAAQPASTQPNAPSHPARAAASFIPAAR